MWVWHRPIFFLLLGGGILFLFATTAATNVAVMAAVPAGSRSFAIGLSTIIMHGFGDVPSPTIIVRVVRRCGMCARLRGSCTLLSAGISGRCPGPSMP